MKPLDEYDYRILELIMENCKLSYKEISKRTGINAMTVMQRIKKLEKSGVIRMYTAKLDPSKLGFNILAYMLINTGTSSEHKGKIFNEVIAKKLEKYPFVSCISTLTGRNDILLRVRARSIEELNKFINKIKTSNKEIKRTETLIVLSDITKSSVTYQNLIHFISNKDYAKSLLGDGVLVE